MTGSSPFLPSQQAPDHCIMTMRSDVDWLSRQRLQQFVGTTADSAAALSMNLVVIPPGAAAEPHYDLSYQTTIFILEGTLCTRYGTDLERETINSMGDFLFVPPNLPHQPMNLSLTETATAVVVRHTH